MEFIMNKSLRKVVIAGNWKMNETPAQAKKHRLANNRNGFRRIGRIRRNTVIVNGRNRNRKTSEVKPIPNV